MNQLYSNGYYSIRKAGKSFLREMSEFVVRENNKHHTGSVSPRDMDKEINSVYQEELEYGDASIVYVVRDSREGIIGCIRVFKWDRKKSLPIQKIFGINLLNAVDSKDGISYWHVGRFAIDSFAGVPTTTLFKQLMALAIAPIVSEKESFMIAEIDRRLLRVMNALGIETKRLGDSVNYLASETIPVCSSRDGLSQFYDRYRHLCQVS